MVCSNLVSDSVGLVLLSNWSWCFLRYAVYCLSCGGCVPFLDDVFNLSVVFGAIHSFFINGGQF